MKRARHSNSSAAAAALSLFLLMAIMPANVQAWSEGGHKIVGLIAWQALDSDTRTKVIQVLASHPMWEKDFRDAMPGNVRSSPSNVQQQWLFAQAAEWPDIARDYTAPPRDYHRQKWHFINLPIFLDASSRDHLGGHLHANLLTAWSPNTPELQYNAVQVIDLAGRVLRDPSAQSSRKALLLTWLFHLVGDVHQPLHSVALMSDYVFPEGDHGGNSILLVKHAGDAHPMKLHSFWDHLLGGDAPLNVLGATAHRITSNNAIMSMARQAASDLTPAHWVEQSRNLAMQSAYTPGILAAVRAAETNGVHGEVEVVMSPTDIGSYGRAAGTVAYQQVAIAGLRLAAVLQRALH